MQGLYVYWTVVVIFQFSIWLFGVQLSFLYLSFGGLADATCFQHDDAFSRSADQKSCEARITYRLVCMPYVPLSSNQRNQATARRSPRARTPASQARARQQDRGPREITPPPTRCQRDHRRRRRGPALVLRPRRLVFLSQQVGHFRWGRYYSWQRQQRGWIRVAHGEVPRCAFLCCKNGSGGRNRFPAVQREQCRWAGCDCCPRQSKRRGRRRRGAHPAGRSERKKRRGR